MEAGVRSDYRSTEGSLWARFCFYVGDDAAFHIYYCVLSLPDLGLLQTELWKLQIGGNGIRSCDSHAL